MPESTIEVRIDREACQGVGSCAIASDGAFDLDDEGKAILTGPPESFDPEKLIAGARSCPFIAITVLGTKQE